MNKNVREFNAALALQIISDFPITFEWRKMLEMLLQTMWVFSRAELRNDVGRLVVFRCSASLGFVIFMEFRIMCTAAIRGSEKFFGVAIILIICVSIYFQILNVAVKLLQIRRNFSSSTHASIFMAFDSIAILIVGIILSMYMLNRLLVFIRGPRNRRN